MPDLEMTALIERLQQSSRRWKWLALSLLAALVLLTTSTVVLRFRAEQQVRQAQAAEEQARQQEEEARKQAEEAKWQAVEETIRAKERRRFNGQQGPIHFLSFSPDGRLLASGGKEGIVFLWE